VRNAWFENHFGPLRGHLLPHSRSEAEDLTEGVLGGLHAANPKTAALQKPPHAGGIAALQFDFPAAKRSSTPAGLAGLPRQIRQGWFRPAIGPTTQHEHGFAASSGGYHLTGFGRGWGGFNFRHRG
jgi:hypothetical protein